MREPLRTLRLSPYRKGCGPRFVLKTFDTGRPNNGHHLLSYELWQVDSPPARVRMLLFRGEDFGCSPLHAIDSDESCAALLSFLTLRPGDTDAEYFDDYTPAQLNFAEQHAEALSAECFARFGDV